MGMSLYQIDQALLDLVDTETGEITDIEALDRLSMERDEKIENVACWYKNLVAEAKAIRDEEKSLADRRQSAERKADSLKRYLGDALQGQKFQTSRCAVTFRKTTAVNVLDPALVMNWAENHDHEDCVRYKDPDLDKTALAKVLKLGIEVPGAELSEGLSVGVK